MRYTILALGLALLVSFCSKKDIGKGESTGRDSLPEVSYLNLSYGADEQQRLDVYLPEARNEKTRLLVIIHGGGWTAGDKSDFDSYITEFKKRLPGYAFANLNYRLATTAGNYFPAQEEDIMSAITYLKSKTADYNISTDFVFLGISAGAHLALLQGYKHSDILQPKGIVAQHYECHASGKSKSVQGSEPHQLCDVIFCTYAHAARRQGQPRSARAGSNAAKQVD